MSNGSDNLPGTPRQTQSTRLDPNSPGFNYEDWLHVRFQGSGRDCRSSMGVAYRNLNVYCLATQNNYQETFANLPLKCWERLCSTFSHRRKSRIDILRDFEGLVTSGEMLLVLGRPGSGCSTLLKTLAGKNSGFYIDDESLVNYQGLPGNTFHTDFRGECTYHAEIDVHFPHLTVGQTLAFAAKARFPRKMVDATNRSADANSERDAIIAALGLSHILDTKIGSDFVRGVSGGELKRASIAEILVGGSVFQCWDNSTRGLDSANALGFVKTLRLSAQNTESVAIVSLYQASEDIYNTFDKVSLLYEGQQIFFGDVRTAKSFFVNLGFVCPDHVATADFLTSLTHPAKRIIRPGHEFRTPRTAEEFAHVWKASHERAELLAQIQNYENEFPLAEKYPEKPRQTHSWLNRMLQARRSPYVISTFTQVGLCIKRGFQRLRGDFAAPLSAIMGNCIMSIIIGSMFYNMPQETSSFFGRGVLLFFTAFLNTYLGAFEGGALWEQRPIVEKHFQYAFNRPMAEAVASMICDIPNKILLTLFFNVPFYFLANLNRSPTAFFTFYLFAFVTLLAGSMLFRTIGALSRTLTLSIAPGAIFVMMLVIYTGFVLPVPSMHPWFRWFGYINPVAYAFESLMINEFSGRRFLCSRFIPEGNGYSDVAPQERQCITVGAQAASSVVDGAAYISESFQFNVERKWSNLAVIFGLMIFLCIVYLTATEYVRAQQSKGEVLLFRRGTLPNLHMAHDEETLKKNDVRSRTHFVDEKCFPAGSIPIETHGATFLWNELRCNVKVKKGTRCILDDVEGWVKPGTLTALMGSSGAGKTTLLNVLANRAPAGTISGEKLMGPKYQDESFTQRIGYAQQQNLHLPTSTVREALEFSALLRQPEKYTKAEKLAYVAEVIETLNMRTFAEAVIGVPGEGLNVEQRKRLTVGVELAARPDLLFLDEPTSGLDSDTAWSLCTLLRKLADSGQTILCTIHQPSAILFQMFDRLLFLADGGSLYFGDIGPNSKDLVEYFEKRGAKPLEVNSNPAEWLLNVTSNAQESNNRIDWAEQWRNSDERRAVKSEILEMKVQLSTFEVTSDSTAVSKEFATPFIHQLWIVTKRTMTQDWRTPAYLYSKVFLIIGMGIFNGFSFYRSSTSLQGIQNQLFSVFLLMTAFSELVQLIMPQFLVNRTLYELRERPSRTYSWKIFVLSNIIAEIPWQTLMSVIFFVTWYYPLGLHRNAMTMDQVHERGGLMFLLLWSYMIFCSTFAQMFGTIVPDAPTGVNISSLFYVLSLISCGVLVSPAALPRFWIFMYRVTPVTYFVNAIVSTKVAGADVICAANELVRFNPPFGQDCASYLTPFLTTSGGTLINPQATDQCLFCPISNTDAVLRSLGIYFEHRWRNFGITLVYSLVNVAGALFLYWLFRVPKGFARRR